jgi:hypothetical protein
MHLAKARLETQQQKKNTPPLKHHELDIRSSAFVRFALSGARNRGQMQQLHPLAQPPYRQRRALGWLGLHSYCAAQRAHLCVYAKQPLTPLLLINQR